MRNISILFAILFVFTIPPRVFCAEAVPDAAVVSSMPWWILPILLFVCCFFLGIIAVMGGVGGGVLFVPIVGSFFPFHLDYVRGAGLLTALCGSLASSPKLLRSGMVNLRIAIPVALVTSTSAIVGAMIGLVLPERTIQTLMGLTIIGIVILMFLSKRSEFPNVDKPDLISASLQISGIYHEPMYDKDIKWKVHRTPLALLLFVGIGILAGMFGLGAGWANVPVFNLVMGAPLKVSVASSMFTLSITSSSATWIYLNNGAVLPMIAVPSIFGMMAGASIGVKLLHKTKPSIIRIVIFAMLLISGSRALLKGLEIWN